MLSFRHTKQTSKNLADTTFKFFSVPFVYQNLHLVNLTFPPSFNFEERESQYF